MRMKHILLFTAILALYSVKLIAVTPDQAENELLSAYSDMQYAKTKQIAAKSDRPEFKLLSAMCDVFDRRAQKLKRGLSELQRLANSPELPERYRCTAKLAYARAIHTMAMRKNIYPEAKNIDPVPLYDEVILMFPETIDCIYAVIYRTQYLISKNKTGEALDFAEKFILSFKGTNKRLLYPIHMLLFNEHIRNGGRYDIAIKHAERVRELVPANPKTQYTIHFKIARIYDAYLKDDLRAEKEYVSFLEKHPDNTDAILAKRYLKELRERRAR